MQRTAVTRGSVCRAIRDALLQSRNYRIGINPSYGPALRQAGLRTKPPALRAPQAALFWDRTHHKRPRLVRPLASPSGYPPKDTLNPNTSAANTDTRKLRFSSGPSADTTNPPKELGVQFQCPLKTRGRGKIPTPRLKIPFHFPTLQYAIAGSCPIIM